MMTFIYCTSPLCLPLHVSDKLSCVAGGEIRAMLPLLNAGTGLALSCSGKGPLSFRAPPLWEERRLGISSHVQSSLQCCLFQLRFEGY